MKNHIICGKTKNGNSIITQNLLGFSLTKLVHPSIIKFPATEKIDCYAVFSYLELWHYEVDLKKWEYLFKWQADAIKALFGEKKWDQVLQDNSFNTSVDINNHGKSLASPEYH